MQSGQSQRALSSRPRDAQPRTIQGTLTSQPIFGSPPALLPLLSPSNKSKNLKPPIDLYPGAALGPESSRELFKVARQSWTSTTHIFPAAFPRSHPFATSPPAKPVAGPEVLPENPVEAKAEEEKRRKIAFEEWERRTNTHTPESLYPATTPAEAVSRARVLSESNDAVQPQLWCSVQRIVPSDPPEEGLTIVFSHATSTHKETWQPTILSMLQRLASSPGSPSIREIWSLDSVDSGESGALNRSSLGEILTWFDNPRDIKQFIGSYLPSPGNTDIPAALLARQTQSTASQHRLVGIGHSFAGTSLAFLTSDSPELFEHIILLDPGMAVEGIFSMDEYIRAEDYPMSRGTIARKSVFASKEAAHTYFASRPTFARWDPQVLSLYVNYALHAIDPANPSGPCTLSNPPALEAAAYGQSWQNRYAYDSLRKGKYRTGVHTVTMSEPSFVLASAEVARRVREAAGERGTSEVMDGGHMVVQEQPQALGALLADSLSAKVTKTSRSARM